MEKRCCWWYYLRMVGVTLGKYETGTVLGRGAVGTVYEAWDPVLRRKVAIKAVRLPAASEIEAQNVLDRFLREAQAAARLNHANIVSVFDYGEADDLAYIVMELVEGRSLKAVIEAEQPLALPFVRRVMADLLSGLQYSHEHGVIHRDIKPSNIMLTPDGRAKIADFGIARVEHSEMTQVGMVMGTPAYMSPEQFTGQTVDLRTDIYSAGIVLYELLTGGRPYEGNATTVTYQALQARTSKVADPLATAHLTVNSVAERALARRPDDRYPSACMFAKAVEAALIAVERQPTRVAGDAEKDPTFGSAGHALKPDAGAPTLPIKRRQVRALAAFSLALLASAGTGAWWLRFHGEAPTGPPEVAQDSVTPPTKVPDAPSYKPGPTPARSDTPANPPGTAPEAESPPGSQIGKGFVPQTDPTNRATQTPEPRASFVGLDEHIALPIAAPPEHASAASSGDHHLVPPMQMAMGVPQPGEFRLAVRDAIAQVPCVLVSGNVIRDGGALEVNGALSAGANASLNAAIAKVAPTLSVEWHVAMVDAQYCGAIEMMRSLSAKFGMPDSGLRLSTADGQTHLQQGDRIALGIVAPNFRSRVQLDYLQNDNSVYHMQPSPGYPSSVYEPLSYHRWGDLRPGVVDPAVVQPPFGLDMIIAIASETPLFREARPDVETTDRYLHDLRAAIEAAKDRREIIAGAALVLTTSEHR